MRALVVGFALAAVSCTTVAEPTSARRPRERARRRVPLLADLTLPAVDAPDPNGESDSAPYRAGPRLRSLATAGAARFESIGAADTAHPLVCDLLGFRDGLYAAHSVRPLVRTGARIHRYDGRTWQLAFDWDRGGTTSRVHRWGAEGFTRIRTIGGRLLVPDPDTPGPGFALSSAPYEEYLFVSDETGALGEPGRDGAPPPNTRIAPLSFHAFDVIAYRGALVVSGGTGVIGPGRWGPFPGGLWAGDPDASVLPLRYQLGPRYGVVRTTYMHRFKGRLYVGFENNERRARWDLAVLSGDPRDPHTPEPVLARVTPDGGWLTYRFASTTEQLYWLASGYRPDGRGSALFASTDGRRFDRIELPPDAGDAQDLAIVDDVRYLLAEGGLYRAGADDQFARLAPAPDGDPWGRYNTYCGAPLTVWRDQLYAGSKRDGSVYVVTAN